ncbi:hypothetical protein GCM10010919_07920 [Alishewanella longhuensis]|uniref:diguanylate cyclase n=1 Tax=Alishewanella longhuensis TaxID=1091037 RepID=A0ABQ3L3L8_9ALTE|nr:GGDEF domain-containing protein [Alishewanella longhuensis]GHG62537.1 hypothetical protein GCM10010919_07920 [Alishewanella longhuensis]
MSFIKHWFPSLYYLDAASEVAFRHYIVQRTKQTMQRLVLVCVVLLVLFNLTDLLLGDSWHSLNNLTRAGIAMLLLIFFPYSTRLTADNYLQGWLLVSALVILLLIVTFYAAAQYYGELGEGGPMLVAIALTVIPIFNVQQKILLWLLLFVSVAFLKYCTTTDTAWSLFYLSITIFLCFNWQRQLDILLRSQFKAVRLETQKAETDQLTGLLNRRSFEQRLQQKLQALQPGQQLSLGLLDIDFFKYYNDCYGHLDGDLVLVNISRLLSQDPALLVVRFGGEEFILVEQHPAEQAPGLLSLPEQLYKLNYPHSTSPFGVVTASIGIATISYPAKYYSSSELMQIADNLLYQAKEQGRNQAVQHYLPTQTKDPSFNS